MGFSRWQQRGIRAEPGENIGRDWRSEKETGNKGTKRPKMQNKRDNKHVFSDFSQLGSFTFGALISRVSGHTFSH